jgi:release factor glutamine methyltransferase
VLFLEYKTKDIKNRFINELANIYPAGESESIFHFIIEHVFGIKKHDLLLNPAISLSDKELVKLDNCLKRLKQNEPVQYIVGKTFFYGIEFLVNNNVLIPRPETEELVSWVLETVKFKNLADTSILDIGTGSGCIAVALKKHLPFSGVYAWDVSEGSVEVAKQNAIQNNVFVNIEVKNILTVNELYSCRFNVIVSNPPYITPSEKHDMHPNVVQYEPHTALFVGNNNALRFYECIAKFASEALKPEGYLFFEINENRGEEVKKLLLLNNYHEVEIKKDINGKPRMVKAQKKRL